MSRLPDTILKGGHQRTKQRLVPIGPVVSEMKIFLFLVTATMLVGGRDCRTQFWKGITNGPFHQSLILSGQVVSEENIISNCVRTDDRRNVMTKAHLILWVRWAKKKKGGAYYFLSMVKSQKIQGFNNNFLICNRWNGTFSEFNTPSRSPKEYIIHWK
jgi:hypothetical protein